MSESPPQRAAMPAGDFLAEIDHAIADHLDWLMDLNRAVARPQPPSAAELAQDPHHLCRFGSWYVKNRHRGLVDQPAVHALADAHREMHDRARRLLDRAHAGVVLAEDEHRAFAGAVRAFVTQARRLEKAFSAAASELDALTGLRNRQSMDAELERERTRAARGGRGCAVALADIDRFKGINDSFGHAVGDAVLAAVAERLLTHVRPYDSLYRYGGEEFLLCLPDTGIEEAAATLDRLRAALAAEAIEVAGGRRIPVTASFGVAAIDAGAPLEESVRRADAALYEAKQAGRDRVRAWRGAAAESGRSSKNHHSSTSEVRMAANYKAVSEAGAEAPWLVMVHGMSHDHRIFSAQVAAFKDRFRILLVDLPGHGLSVDQPGPFGHVELARQVAGAMADAGVAHCHYWGTHTGTALGLLLLAQNPERFHSMILEGAVLPGRVMPSVVESYQRTRGVAQAEGVDAARRHWIEDGRWFDVIRERPDECRADEHWRILCDFPGAPWFEPHAPQPAAPVDDALASIAVPVLVYNGERDVRDFIEVAERLEALLPNARRATIAEAGGFPAWEFPERVNRVVADFLSSPLVAANAE